MVVVVEMMSHTVAAQQGTHIVDALASRRG